MKFLLLRRALTSGLQAFPKRRAYTLLELLLALALTVLVSGLVGMLLQIYYKSSELSQSEVRQAQIARNLLRMIADDLRSVVRYQEFDDSTLSSVLSASAGGAAGGMSSDSSGASSGDSSGASSGGSSSAGASPGTGTSGGASMGGGSTSSGGSAMGGSSSSSPSSSGSTGSSTTSDTSSSSSEDTAANTTDLAASTTPPPTPGLYGNQYELMVDVSRLPRPDQYYSQQMSSLSTQMPDVPSDIKSVLYYVQTSGNSMGIQDPLQSGSLTGIAVEPTAEEAIKAGGGLVRRQLDRAVTQWANDQGQSDRLMRTGELLASEVVSLEFNYYDGTQWLTQWDSSQQNLPLVVKIQLGMQDPGIAKTQPLAAGTPVSSMAADQLQTYGVRVYELSVAIPGAQLMEPVATDSGMESMGVQQ
jgi:type II secretory pathway pseudopilin PulG